MEEENHIKKRLNIYLYYWTIPFLIFFILLNYYSRNFKFSFENIGLMISVLSFLFGFLININFSMIQSRINSLKTDLAGETGVIISLYYRSKGLGSKFHERITEIIDEYTMKTLRNYNHYNVGREVFDKINNEIQYMEIKDDSQKALASSFFSNLSDWEPIRERLEYFTEARTEWSLRFSTYILGILLIGLLFLNRADFFTNVLFIILSTVIVFIFLIIEDFERLNIQDYEINISNSEQIFDLIGKNRYYPEELIGRVKLKNGRDYRIGIYDSKEKKEKIFLIKYNSRFGFNLKHLLKGLHSSVHRYK